MTTLDTPQAEGEPHRTEPEPLFDSRFPLRLMVAVAGSALICLAVWLTRATHLSGYINIVGYPTFADYDYVPTFLGYRLVTYAFPAGVIVIYAVLAWRGPLRRPRGDSRSQPVPLVSQSPAQTTTATSGSRGPAGLWLRLIPPAIVVGVAVGPHTALSLADVWLLRLASASGYVVAVAGVSWLVVLAVRRYAPSRTCSFDHCLVVVNAAGGALAALGGLWLISHNTVTVLRDGSIHHWPWLPWWLAAAGIIAAWAWMVHQLRRGRAAEVVEQQLRNVLVGSALVYLITAAIPGVIAGFSGFDDAQGLTGAALLQRGYFPWRDFMFIHGLFTDVLAPLIGFHMFQPTEWGMNAVTYLVLSPLSWVALYLLGLWAARRGALIMLGTLVLAASGAIVIEPRFIVVPLALILLGKAISSPRLGWTSALTVALFVSAIAAPETDYLVIAVFLVVVGAEVVHRQPGQRLAVTLRRTLCFVCTGAILSAAGAVFLASQHALTAFIDWYVVFVPGHNAEGDIHPYLVTTFEYVMFGLVIGLAIATFLTAAFRGAAPSCVEPCGLGDAGRGAQRGRVWRAGTCSIRHWARIGIHQHGPAADRALGRGGCSRDRRPTGRTVGPSAAPPKPAGLASTAARPRGTGGRDRGGARDSLTIWHTPQRTRVNSRADYDQAARLCTPRAAGS